MTVEQLIQKLQSYNPKAKATVCLKGVEEDEITYNVSDVSSPTLHACIISVEVSDEERDLKTPRLSEKHINFCDDCIHFRPCKEGECKPDNELCEFVRELKFKNSGSYFGTFDNNWGFYFPGCKDFEKE